MNFFQAQERARRTSRLLVLAFAAATAGVVATVYLLAAWARNSLFMPSAQSFGALPPSASGWWVPELAAWIMPLTGGIVVLGSAYKLARLSAGGAVVARDLGGRQVDPSTSDPLERRLINVVEEMSIASGLPVPEIWLLDDENGINAFAAGTEPANAALGFTRGCLESLSRDELQGVVAHEFSHILNGDMRLNMRLTGWIFGLVMIAMLGRMVLQLFRHVRFSSSDNGRGGAAVVLALVAAGACLWLVGSIGALFARFLQAAVSRQREFLADASAVQFTRNPAGIANALRKIGGHTSQGTIQSPQAAEARHLFFARSDLLGLSLATHPPLERRIRAIVPDWDGKFLRADRRKERSQATETPPPRSARSKTFARPGLNQLSAGSGHELPDPALGAEIHRRLVEGNTIFRSKQQAQAMLQGLFLSADPTTNAPLLAMIGDVCGEEHAAAVQSWGDVLRQRDAREKIALVDLSLPWLRKMSREEAADFLRLNSRLTAADGQASLFEFLLEAILERHVGIALGLREAPQVRHRQLADLAPQAAVLLAAFAGQAGHPAARNQAAAEYRQHTGHDLGLADPADCGLDRVRESLRHFAQATPLVKNQILRLCALTAAADGVLHDPEIELLRATADALGMPMPAIARPDSHGWHTP